MDGTHLLAKQVSIRENWLNMKYKRSNSNLLVMDELRKGYHLCDI